MGSLVALDFEGTSRLPSARATEIGLVQLSENFQIVSEFESVINSPIAPDKSALSISRLSKGELSTAPTFGQIWPAITHWFSGNILIAHNKTYEANVLSNEFKANLIGKIPPIICTLEWSRKILGLKVKNHTLPELCNYFDIDFPHAHEALADAKATAELLSKLVTLSPALVNEIQALKPEVVSYSEIPGKKHKPQIRERFQIQKDNDDRLASALHRVTKLRKTLVVVTGTPDEGKEEFRVVMAAVGLEYRETPPTLGTAFVVQANISPGMSKIRRALEIGIPVLSESDALLLAKKLKGV